MGPNLVSFLKARNATSRLFHLCKNLGFGPFDVLSRHSLYNTRNGRNMKNVAGSMTRELKKKIVTFSVSLYNVISLEYILLVV